MLILPSQQRRLLILLLKNLRMKEICGQMELSSSTVDTYAKIIYKRAGVETRVGLLLAVYREKSLDQLLKANQIEP